MEPLFSLSTHTIEVLIIMSGLEIPREGVAPGGTGPKGIVPKGNALRGNGPERACPREGVGPTVRKFGHLHSPGHIS